MTEISIPYHLIIPCIISTLVVVSIFFKRKKLFKSGKMRLFWISLTVFFGVYAMILIRATYIDISTALALQNFDLNGDGFFNKKEITTEQIAALRKVTADTGRNLSLITGLIFSGIIALFVYGFGNLAEFIRKKSVSYN